MFWISWFWFWFLWQPKAAGRALYGESGGSPGLSVTTSAMDFFGNYPSPETEAQGPELTQGSDRCSKLLLVCLFTALCNHHHRRFYKFHHPRRKPHSFSPSTPDPHIPPSLDGHSWTFCLQICLTLGLLSPQILSSISRAAPEADSLTRPAFPECRPPGQPGEHRAHGLRGLGAGGHSSGGGGARGAQGCGLGSVYTAQAGFLYSCLIVSASVH